jgi:hypothetical protein
MAQGTEEELAIRRQLLTTPEGDSLDAAWVEGALRASLATGQPVASLQPGDVCTVLAAPELEGSGVVVTGQSFSAPLRCRVAVAGGGPAREIALYVKKVQAASVAAKAKTPAALARDLGSCHNECALYQHVAPLLRQGGFTIPAPLYVGELSLPGQLVTSEYMMVLECVSPELYLQVSPLSGCQADCTLELLAKMHAWAWGDEAKLALLRRELHPRASYWDLPRRGIEEMRCMPEVWQGFVRAFGGESERASELLRRPRVAALGERLLRLGSWVSEQIHGPSSEHFHTLVHGDFKAMNVFVPRDSAAAAPAGSGGEGSGGGGGGANGSSTAQPRSAPPLAAVPIDFQWSGVGLAMLDVAMHCYHSVELAGIYDTIRTACPYLPVSRQLHCTGQTPSS